MEKEKDLKQAGAQRRARHPRSQDVLHLETLNIMIAGCSDCKDGFVARLLLIFKEHNQDLQTGICISNFKDEDTDGKIPSKYVTGTPVSLAGR